MSSNPPDDHDGPDAPAPDPSLAPASTPAAPAAVTASAPKRGKFLTYLLRLGAGSLAISILVHVFFVGLATIYVVSVVTEQRKVAFTGGGSGDGSGGPASETRHQVSVARQNTTPVPSSLSQKLVVEGASSVALPELPALGLPPSAASSSAGAVGSLGGGLGSGGGTGAGAGPGTGALRMMPFGLSAAPKSGALTGTLYLLPSDQYKTNKEEFDAFKKWLKALASSGWSESTLNALPKSPRQLFTTQILIPEITALDAPKAFGVDKQKSVVRFLIRYRGKVSPPRNGNWRFVGFGDDMLVVRLNGKVVLEAFGKQAKMDIVGHTGWTPRKQYPYDNLKYTVGDWNRLNTAGSYDLEIYLSEEPREGTTTAILLVEEEGATYKKNAAGSPILPPWTLAPAPTVNAGNLTVPIRSKDAPVWLFRGL